MTLVELVFSQTIRIISFEDVAKATLLNTDEVEHLVMRALSLGLLKGSIDQINQLITINWVQPRIINQKQIEQMKTKLIQWDSNVSKLGEFMEANGKELWIQ
jgi:26S proteasome regulatory subunit N9